jgi:hypothetical protein
LKQKKTPSMKAFCGVLIAGVVLSIGLGCSSSSIGKADGSLTKDGIMKATSSKYQIFHVEWGNDSIGSLAHSHGIRYVLRSSHRKAGLPFVFSKRETTIIGFTNKESLDKWKAQLFDQSKPRPVETADMLREDRILIKELRKRLAANSMHAVRQTGSRALNMPTQSSIPLKLAGSRTVAVSVDSYEERNEAEEPGINQSGKNARRTQ